MASTTKPRNARWREALASQGRSLAWLADRTGVSRRTVYAYSRGARRPQEAWLARTADVLGVPLAELTGEQAA